MNIYELANQEAERIEADESLTDNEKTRYLKDLGEQLAEHERNYPNEL